ncbi:MAG: ABC transporter permease, partial [Scardovia wiggsiae]
MNDLVTTFQNRFGDWAEALLQHLQISLLSLLIAILISVPLAVWLFNKKKASEAILQITGIFQTIPSLALLGLLIPVMGIGTVPAVTALVVYALFPIVQNTITGLQGIDPNLVEAGTAFGMTRWERLRKYELPLAMPVIVSGVRTSAVMIIGTATLAALIGAGGLGSFILLGIDRNNTSLILIGAISSALLAILFSLVIRWLEKRSLKQILAAFLVLIVGLAGS